MMYVSSMFSQTTTPPYTQNFTTFPLTGWTFGYTSSVEIGTGPKFISSYPWLQKPFLANTSENNPSLRLNLYTANISHWAITNTFDLSGGDYEMSFDLGTAEDPFQTNPSEPAPQIEAGDKFKILITTDAGASWQELKGWDNPNITIPNQRTTYKIDVSAYHGSNVRFAFFASDGTVLFPLASYCIYIDNFKIQTKGIMATAESGKSLFGIYPNPTADRVSVKSAKSIKSLELFDLTGKKITSTLNKELDLSDYSKGIYMLKANFIDGASESQKIIKK